jgi:hypothetical protein
LTKEDIENRCRALPTTTTPLPFRYWRGGQIRVPSCSPGGEASFYLDNGGKIEYNFDAITSMAEEQASLAFGEFEESWGDDSPYSSPLEYFSSSSISSSSDSDSTRGPPTPDVILPTRVGNSFTSLPTCRNDLEFGLVRFMLGLCRDWAPVYPGYVHV